MLFLTHHKCTSTFLGRYLTDFSDLNNLSYFNSHRGDAGPNHEFDVNYLSNANYQSIRTLPFVKAVHVIRNPLNIIQSAYYSHLATHPTDGWPELITQRSLLNLVNRSDGMLLTIAFCERQEFYDATPGPLAALRRWNFDDPRIVTVRSEDLVKDPTTILTTILGDVAQRYEWPATANYTFERFSGGRAPGAVDEASHYRTGDPDAWRRELPPAAITYIRHQFQHLLARFYPASL